MKTILLAGDIGGTKTILRLVESQTTLNQSLPTQTLIHQATYPSQNYPDLVPLVQQFLLDLPESQHQPPTIAKACFGIAGPVVNNTSTLTNLNWNLSATRLQAELKISQVALINDFAAIGYGILGLSQEDVCPLQQIAPNPDAPIAVLGAGTGLGEGFLIPSGKGDYQVFSTEGSHVEFAPQNELELELVNFVKETKNCDRVSVERLVSGPGIISIYQFLRARGLPESPALAVVFSQGDDVDFAAAISQEALAGNDELCQQTMALFIKFYGAEAGNLALKLLPYGGLYIAGGIAAKNLTLMQQGDFMNAFKSKGRMSPLMEKIPVSIILNPQVGLMGAAIYAAKL